MQLLSLFASLPSISPCKRNQGKSGGRSRHLWIGLRLSLLIRGSPQFQQQLSPPWSLQSYQPSMILITWGNPRPHEFRSALHRNSCSQKKAADREMAKTESKEQRGKITFGAQSTNLMVGVFKNYVTKVQEVERNFENIGKYSKSDSRLMQNSPKIGVTISSLREENFNKVLILRTFKGILRQDHSKKPKEWSRIKDPRGDHTISRPTTSFDSRPDV